MTPIVASVDALSARGWLLLDPAAVASLPPVDLSDITLTHTDPFPTLLAEAGWLVVPPAHAPFVSAALTGAGRRQRSHWLSTGWNVLHWTGLAVLTWYVAVTW